MVLYNNLKEIAIEDDTCPLCDSTIKDLDAFKNKIEENLNKIPEKIEEDMKNKESLISKKNKIMNMKSVWDEHHIIITKTIPSLLESIKDIEKEESILLESLNSIKMKKEAQEEEIAFLKTISPIASEFSRSFKEFKKLSKQIESLEKEFIELNESTTTPSEIQQRQEIIKKNRIEFSGKKDDLIENKDLLNKKRIKCSSLENEILSRRNMNSEIIALKNGCSKIEEENEGKLRELNDIHGQKEEVEKRLKISLNERKEFLEKSIEIEKKT